MKSSVKSDIFLFCLEKMGECDVNRLLYPSCDRTFVTLLDAKAFCVVDVSLFSVILREK